MKKQEKERYSDEIDLLELTTKLWKEKLTILAATLAISAMGFIYALTTPPIYEVSAQLVKPTSHQLSHFNRTDFFTIKPETAFEIFLNTLESDDHLGKLKENHTQLLKSALNFDKTENTHNLSAIRNTSYPNTNKKANHLTPDKYFFYYQGISKEKLKELAFTDLAMAKKTTIDSIHLLYKTTINNKIDIMARKQDLDLKNLEDALESRKILVLETRRDNLKELEEALKIAKALEITAPTSLNKLASNINSKQIEINTELNNHRSSLLYLRGTRLLTAEIENLKGLDETEFLDKEIRKLRAKKIIVKNNRELEQLKTLAQENIAINGITFYSESINSPKESIEPKKSVILTISIILGIALGIFISIVKIAYKKAN